jgi:hypothetical protein
LCAVVALVVILLLLQVAGGMPGDCIVMAREL